MLSMVAIPGVRAIWCIANLTILAEDVDFPHVHLGCSG
jgi:hypothetical protein